MSPVANQAVRSTTDSSVPSDGSITEIARHGVRTKISPEHPLLFEHPLYWRSQFLHPLKGSQQARFAYIEDLTRQRQDLLRLTHTLQQGELRVA